MLVESARSRTSHPALQRLAWAVAAILLLAVFGLAAAAVPGWLAARKVQFSVDKQWAWSFGREPVPEIHQTGAVIFEVAYQGHQLGPLRVRWPITETNGEVLAGKVERLVETADDQLFRLRPREARETYAAAHDEAQILGGPGSYAQEDAALGAARASMELGEFEPAVEWLRKWSSRPQSSRCGTCAEGKRARARVIRFVWEAAALPPQTAIPKLRRFTGGESLRQEVAVEHWLEPAAAAEANLLLGELLLGLGDAKGARAALETARRLAGGKDKYVPRLAREHLRRARAIVRPSPPLLN